MGYLPEFVDSHNHAHVATENIVKSFYDIVSECSMSARALIESSFLEVPRFLGLHLMGQNLSVDRLEKTLEILGLNGWFGDFELMVHPGFKTLRKGGCTSD